MITPVNIQEESNIIINAYIDINRREAEFRLCCHDLFNTTRFATYNTRFADAKRSCRAVWRIQLHAEIAACQLQRGLSCREQDLSSEMRDMLRVIRNKVTMVIEAMITVVQNRRFYAE